MERFELDAAGEASDACEKERAAIGEFLVRACEAFKPHGQPTARQLRIQYRLDEIEVPLIGYVDYSYPRSEEHTSELQSLMRNSYAVFCLKQNNTTLNHT